MGSRCQRSCSAAYSSACESACVYAMPVPCRNTSRYQAFGWADAGQKWATDGRSLHPGRCRLRPAPAVHLKTAGPKSGPVKRVAVDSSAVDWVAYDKGALDVGFRGG